jgi:hypothetical protein
MSTLKINGKLVKSGTKRDVEAAVKRHYETHTRRDVFFEMDGNKATGARVETDYSGNSLCVEHGRR